MKKDLLIMVAYANVFFIGAISIIGCLVWYIASLDELANSYGIILTILLGLVVANVCVLILGLSLYAGSLLDNYENRIEVKKPNDNIKIEPIGFPDGTVAEDD